MNRAQRRAAEKATAAAVRNMKTQGAVDLKSVPTADSGPPRASLAYCWNERIGVSGYWHQSVLKALAGTARSLRWREIPVESGPHLARARNAAIDRFLQTEDEYLLFTDTDSVFEPADVLALLEADKPIAGALQYQIVTGVDPWPIALVAEVADASYETEDGTATFETGEYVPVTLPEVPEPPATPEGLEELSESETAAALQLYSADLTAHEAATAELLAPMKVAGVGFGLMLVRREVVEAVRSIYPSPVEFEGTKGEDLVFCLRAAEMGFDTYLVPRARIGHSKVVVV
ncbi:MAG TPA: hypothetical protein VIU40_00865 [Geobacteraceae bacterium]